MTTEILRSSTVDDLRPRLRDDVVWLESDDGVFVRSTRSAMVLRGASTYRLMASVSRYLTGEHTVGELCDGLGRAQATAVSDLVRALVARGMAVDVRETRGGPLPASLADRFAAQVSFLANVVDDPVGAFTAFRQARVLLGGSGQALQALASGLVANGIGTLHLMEVVDDPDRAGIASAAGPVGAEVRADPGADLATFDLVVYCADRADLAFVADLVRRCAAARVRLLPAVLRDGRAMLGPLSRPGSPCWMCAQLRLAANDPAETTAGTWREIALGPAGPDPAPVGDAVARMIGSAAAFEVFRETTGAIAPDTDGAVLIQDAITLESSIAPLRAHPHCPVCGPAGTATYPTATDDGSDDDRRRALTALVEPRVGVFAGFTDDDLPQLPLRVARLRSGAPHAGGGRREFVAFDAETVPRARLAVLRTAIAHYADRVAAAPVRVGRAGDLDAPAVPPETLDLWAGLAVPGARLAWVRATSLRTGAASYVPAAAVYPFGAPNHGRLMERTPAGIGVGADTGSMVLDGLCGALAYRTLDALLRGRARVAVVDPAGLGTDPRLAFLRDCLGHLGHAVTLRAVDSGTGAAEPAVVLAGTDGPDGPDGPRWQIGVGRTRSEALDRALSGLLGRAQLAVAGSPADLGDPLLTDLPADVAPTVDAVPPLAPVRVETLLATVAAHGDAYLVPTLPADVAVPGGYRVGRVLLTRRHPH